MDPGPGPGSWKWDLHCEVCYPCLPVRRQEALEQAEGAGIPHTAQRSQDTSLVGVHFVSGTKLVLLYLNCLGYPVRLH